MCPLGSGKTALRFPIHGNSYVATGNSIKPRWEIKTIPVKRVETYLASWMGKNIDKNKQKLQKSIVLTYMTTHRISWEFNMNPGYFSLVANTLKPQQLPMFLYTSARIWGHRWYLQTSEQCDKAVIIFQRKYLCTKIDMQRKHAYKFHPIRVYIIYLPCMILKEALLHERDSDAPSACCEPGGK